MKILKRLTGGILIFFVVIYVLPASLLQIPYFQERISHQVASYLNKKLQTEVHIGQIELGFFNKLVLKDVYLEDKSGEVLFQAKRVAAGFDLFPLLQKKWRFDSIQLFTFQFNLSKETDDSPLNIQYIIDAFAKKDTVKTNPEIDLRIKQLNLRSGSFSFRVKDKAETPGVFNPKHLLLTNISSKIRINNLTNKELALLFDKLGFHEQSGLELKNLTFDLVANEKTAKINQLTVELEKSSLHFLNLSANYNLSPKNKDDNEPVTFKAQLKNSTIYPQELSAIIPIFSHFDDKVNLEGDFTGDGNDLAIKNFYFRYYDQVMISANANFQNVFSPNKNLFYIKGDISNSFFSPEGIERLVNNLSNQPVELPQQVKQMKNIRFEGNVNGSLDDLAAWGVLNTDVGVIRTNITIGNNGVRFIKGQIASDNVNMEKLLNNKDYGDMTFDIQLDAKQNPDKKFAGTINANLAKFVYKGYTYRNLNLNGEFSPTSFEGQMNLNSPEGKIEGEGLWAFNGKDSKFDFNAKVSDLQLDKLNLTNKYQHPLLSFEVNANLTGDDLDDFAGTVSLKNLYFKTEKESYFLDNLLIASKPEMQEKRLAVESKVLSGELFGNFTFKTLIPALKQTFARYLPTLVKPDPKYSGDDNPQFSIHLGVEDMTSISKAFELPFTLRGPTDIDGEYKDSKMSLDLKTPHAQFGGSRIDSLQLFLNSSMDTARVDIAGISLQKKNTRLKFDIGIDAADDKLNTLLHWGNGSSNYRGDLKLTTSFLQAENRSPIRVETNIQQTEMIFNDSIWTLYPAKVIVDSSNVQIEHLQAFHKDQYFKIQGEISHNPEKELQIDLNRVNLDYIFQSLSIPALEFGGLATGFVTAQDLFLTRKMETHLDITDFSFNSVNFGHLDLTGTWDDKNQGVLMLGKITKNDSTFVDVNGIIYPVKEELSINFDAQNADARFLRKYMDKVVQDLSGSMSGHLRLFGDLNNPTVEGDVYAKNCRFGIGYLNTFYTFTDSIKCLPDTIKANNITLYDERGNKATASGYVKHHLFQDFYFSANVNYSNFMIFNATKTLNPMFYGTAFGNGAAQISGTQDVINIDVTAQNVANTKMTLNFMEEADIVDYDFIRFVSVKNQGEDAMKIKDIAPPVSSASTEGPEIRFNLLLDVTPDATIEMVMDPVSGDKISGYGKGNLQIQYGTKIPLKVLGNYAIEHGKYNFSLQQLFIRNFDIQDGSSVAFRGDPYAAQLNIKANYTVNANLEDLDPMLIENKKSARNVVPVSCILLLTGPLNRPAVAFDLDLPGATEELVRQVKGYIRTDDMMSRQIVYLLVLSRFYTPPENMRDNSANANSNLSYLTSTLSTQISNLLGLLSDNFRVGTIFHQTNNGAQTGSEFDLLLSSQLLNNRLIVNGNFGYSDRSFYNTNQNRLPVVGDFDVEYKLTPGGDIRLKGFNHYNYRYFNSITPEMTQGIGILFRKDFNYWLDMFKKKKNQ